MLPFEEERVEALRLRLGLRGFPGPEDVQALADALAGCIRVVVEPALRRATCCHLSGGQALVMLPRTARQEERADALLEEIAHYLCTTDRAAVLAASCDAPGAAVLDRWRRRWEQRSEREASDFCAAWRLPSALVAGEASDAEVAWLSGCSLEQIQERRARLRGRVYRLQSPPVWSARRVYRVRSRPGPLPMLRLESGLQDLPNFAFHAPRSEFEALRRELNGDLWALTPRELALRHARRIEEHEADATLELDDLRAA